VLNVAKTFIGVNSFVKSIVCAHLTN